MTFMKLILSIDCGTQSLRTLIFNKAGTLLAVEKVYFQPYFSKNNNEAEQDPLVYYNALCEASKGLKKKHPQLFDQIAGVVVTTQRDTSIIIDKDLNPIRPAILWLDQRSASCTLKDNFRSTEISAYKLVGMDAISELVMKKSKAYWIKEHEPENWRKTYKFILLSCYLNMMLTGEVKDSIANNIGHVPFNARTLKYPSKPSSITYRQFGLEQDKLAELVEVGEILGAVTNKASADTGLPIGTPVIAGASDKGCETLGVGCLNETTGSISFGTTATIQTTTDKYIEPLTFIPPYPAAIKGKYNPEYEVFRGYWLISWFKKEFAHHEVELAKQTGIAPEVILNERLREIPAGSDGLMLQPYWTPGIKMKDARGSIIGFSDVHTRTHIYRAIIEGINYGLLEGLEKIEKCTKTKVKKIFVSGGGSQSSEICQITANMLGRPISRTQTHETSGLGAAMIGYVALGEFETINDAVSKMVKYSDTFLPEAEEKDLYAQLYSKVYKNIYNALNPIYSSLNKILKKGGTQNEQTL